ncbi:glycosyl transferase [Roseitranquillus sediminis]|uniref:glycosyl transferase n=1 Tax=Roseitranquillus sediminis TaxID=2809051 RepID=UPI001D0C2840|nr:glycosyl transferase [Roseitranquillus sediminis]
MGSGPSMRDVDPARLPGFPILLNGAASLHAAFTDHAVAVEDERFVWRHLDMLKAALRPETLRLFSPAVMRALAEQEPDLLRDAPVIVMENLLKPFRSRRRSLEEVESRVLRDGDAAVSREPEQGVVVAGTVAYSVLQFALATEARRIAVAGVDLTNTAAPRFYETAGRTAASGIEAGQARILSHFAVALQLAEERSSRLETVTPGSALERIGVVYAPL